MRNGTQKQRLKELTPVLIVLLVSVPFLILKHPLITKNISPSVPTGYYIRDFKKKLIRNQFVIIESSIIPNSFKKQFKNELPKYICKHVIGFPSDLLELQYIGNVYQIRINKKILFSYQTDNYSLLTFSGVIPANNYFLFSYVENGWDSRYWGFIQRKQITSVRRL